MFINTLSDIFSDNIYSSKLSYRVNMIIISLIIISTLEIILQTEPSLSQLQWLFDTVYILTSVIFLVEVILRYIVAGHINEAHKGFVGKIRFTFQFYTLVDILAVLPFLMGLVGFEMLLYLKAIRVLRILKIMRFLPSVELLQRAISHKKSELFISLQAIFITAILLSIGLYYAESRVVNSPFSSISQAFLWSVAKFIQNIAGYGLYDPVTTAGKFLGTLNGILGIAIFALPAGIIASGFVDEIGDRKKEEEIKSRVNQILKYFKKSYKQKTILDGRRAYDRFSTFENIESRFLLSNAEILECIRNSENLRLRAMKSSEEVKYNDTKLIEHFVRNTDYGCKVVNEKSNVFLINPMGKSERCISHFTYTIIDNLGYNFLSREVSMETTQGAVIGTNKSIHYSKYEANRHLQPKEFIHFMEDLKLIGHDDCVIVVCSGASGRSDFVLEYGNKKGEDSIELGVSTFTDAEKLKQLEETLRTKANDVHVKKSSQKEERFSFTIETHGIGNFEDEWIGKTIHKLTGANVITLYVNIKLLTGEDALYYASLKCLLETFESVFGNFKQEA